MKIPVLPLAAAALFLETMSAFAQEAVGWIEDYAKAQAQAKNENKAILLDFTGSDWCGWCMKMKKETLDTPQFTSYAQKNLVLMTVDFPHQKAQTPAIKQQNAKLSATYRAEGYPTSVLVDKTGRELWRQSGYLQGGPSAFIAAMSKSYTPAPTKASTTSSSNTDDFDAFFHHASPSATP